MKEMKEYTITSKQDKFAYYLAKGLSQRQAYYKAYPNSKKWKPATADSKACTLIKTPKVSKVYSEYVELFRDKEEEKEKERSISIEETLFEEMLSQLEDYEAIKVFVEESIIRNLPDNYKNFDAWLRRNKRKNISQDVRYEVLSKANFRCEACGDSPKINNECVLEVDHIIPHSLGGLDNKVNYQCLCKRCNISKGNRYSINNHEKYVNIGTA